MKKFLTLLLFTLMHLCLANMASAQDFPFEEGVRVRDVITVPDSLTGKGVLVGVLDGDFAYSHINYIDPKTNQTRIRAAFPYKFLEGKHIRVVKPEEINEINPDQKGHHGTHTSGIAAGSYAADGWHGVAPEADLCLADVTGGGKESINMPALKEVFAVADSLGLPLVVNMSIGESFPHHGYNDTDLLFEELTDNGNRPGRIIVVSAGNKGEARAYSVCQIGSEGKVRLAIDAIDGIELQHNFATSKEAEVLKTRLFFYDKVTKTEVTEGGITDKEGNQVGIDELNKFQNVTDDDNSVFRFYKLRTPHDLYYANEDVIPCIEIIGPEGTEIKYIYDTDTDYPEEDDYFTVLQNVIGGPNSLACTPAAISVGRYDTRGAGNIARSSSFGINKYGDKIPDVVAPGTGIISGGAHAKDECNATRDITMPDGTTKTFSWMTMSGTSQATPVVTGLIALMLQYDPTLTTNRVRELLHSTNDWTEACDNAPLGPAQAGHGILNTKALFEALMGRPTAIESISADVEDNATYDLFGRRLSDAPAKGIFIRNNKKIAR